ncbi:Membrane Protein Functionally coupled to the MukBEF Chromosome Partitioning Mechanism [hydrothermal vent metagenome]|uniref:Membrane Protein Functionally coupled to the MukBEF Chromosome Partitioning Mechanism n=1 Tax=hydrothermal vent metagenome TaxID=652676 RepID=A0A1W1DBI1_9ZZZZ
MEIVFITKKIITFFVEPLGLILTLGLIGLYFLNKSAYTKAKFFLSFSIFLLLILSYPPVANSLTQQLESQYSKYDYKNNDILYIHVLGSGHYDNSKWPLSAQIGNASLKRTIEGISIYKKLNNLNIKLIFTGYAGPGNNTTNAEINASVAKIAGISNKKIIVNGRPKNTKEEAIYNKSLTEGKPFVLVTSASHMTRAIKLFEGVGLKPIPAPTDFKRIDVEFLSIPSISSLQKSRIAIHEFLGIAWSYLSP